MKFEEPQVHIRESNSKICVKDGAYRIISIVSNIMCVPFWKTGSLVLGFTRKNEESMFLPVIGLTWYDV